MARTLVPPSETQCSTRNGLFDGSDDSVVDRLHVEAESDNVVAAGLQEILFVSSIGGRHVQIGDWRKFHARLSTVFQTMTMPEVGEMSI